MLKNRVDSIYSELESNVRSYCQTFPIIVNTATDSTIITKDGTKYLDFLMGCGSLNYGHNNKSLKKSLLKYIEEDGIAMSMDFHSSAKTQFLTKFSEIILKPRKLRYKLQFTGPTGTNAVEAALKLARKVTKRQTIISFSNAFHGCTLGSLSVTANESKRSSYKELLNNTIRLPYNEYSHNDYLTYLETAINDPSSGIEAPAAVILECVQGEGGLNVASTGWLKRIEEFSKRTKCLFIIDDVQAGCGRTGKFFSFEDARIKPDIVVLAKSISGFGLPMSLVLVKPKYDIWEKGEHNGTFRGNNHAFITATKVLEQYWSDVNFIELLARNSYFIDIEINKICSQFNLRSKGKGMMRGIEFESSKLAENIQFACFRNGLIIERCGSHENIIKFLPALNIDKEDIKSAFEIITKSIKEQYE